MKRIILDGNLMTCAIKAHEYIAQAMDFPDYYGKNLDALWDILSTYEEATIIFEDYLDICYEETDYREKLINTFLEAAEENSNLILEFQE